MMEMKWRKDCSIRAQLQLIPSFAATERLGSTLLLILLIRDVS